MGRMFIVAVVTAFGLTLMAGTASSQDKAAEKAPEKAPEKPAVKAAEKAPEKAPEKAKDPAPAKKASPKEVLPWAPQDSKK